MVAPLKWLRIWGASSTAPSTACGPEDRVTVKPDVPESQRLRKIRERDERGDRWVPGLPKSAADALRTAIRWQAEIEATGLQRADIARRERLTRARVTQIMSLLELSADVKAMLLAGDPEVEDWSVRRALGAVG